MGKRLIAFVAALALGVLLAGQPVRAGVKHGTKLENLSNVTDRITAFLLLPSDWAEPAAGTTFTV